jgi:transposase InsO family protein
MIYHILLGSTFSGKNPRSFNTSKISNPWLRQSMERRSKSSQIDNGVDYVNHEIHNLFHEVGIQLQHIVPYTPQQNGVVEWKNRSLKEKASCMLHAKSLP